MAQKCPILTDSSKIHLTNLQGFRDKLQGSPMVTDGGKIIRTPASDIRIAGRSTAGVTLFRTAENEKVMSAISIESDGADETETEEVTNG